VEPFSSDGPRRIFFNALGGSLTPGNLSSTGGSVLNKPEFAAADGVSVSGAGGFSSPFFGTSAAAPHAAAIAALMKSAVPGISTSTIRNALLTTAIDLAPTGWDRDSGAGIIMAYEAVNYVQSMPNLAPYQPPSWSDKIAVTTSPTGVTDNGLLYDTDQLFVNWAVVNDSTTTINTPFNVALYLDGTLFRTTTISNLQGGHFYSLPSNLPIGQLPPGQHTLRVVADSSSVITESNESDNSYTRTFYVYFSGYSISGTVHAGSASGPPIAGATVSVFDARGDDPYTTTDAAGAFTLNHVSAGTYTFSVFANGYNQYIVNPYVVTGSQTGLNIVLTSSAPVNGACGTANGGTFPYQPNTTDLCSAGTPSAVSGNGPWSWSCLGSNGGTTATCSANRTPAPGDGACGSSNLTPFAIAPDSNLCTSGTPSAVTGTGPWNWTCVGTSGTNASCSSPVVDITFDLINLGTPAGRDVTIPVTLTRGANVQAATFLVDLHYDTTLLSNPTAVIGAAGTAAGKTLLTSTPSTGVFRIGEYDTGNTPLGNGVVATVTFSVPSTVPNGTVIVVTSDTSASDPAGNNLTTAGRNASITITSIPGDCNGDGTVSSGEFTSAINVFMGRAPSTSCSAFYSNLTVTPAYFTRVINAFMGRF
jgi:hypothetical protein